MNVAWRSERSTPPRFRNSFPSIDQRRIRVFRQPLTTLHPCTCPPLPAGRNHSLMVLGCFDSILFPKNYTVKKTFIICFTLLVFPQLSLLFFLLITLYISRSRRCDMIQRNISQGLMFFPTRHLAYFNFLVLSHSCCLCRFPWETPYVWTALYLSSSISSATKEFLKLDILHK